VKEEKLPEVGKNRFMVSFVFLGLIKSFEL
jgi:hypothetical protein